MGWFINLVLLSFLTIYGCYEAFQYAIKHTEVGRAFTNHLRFLTIVNASELDSFLGESGFNHLRDQMLQSNWVVSRGTWLPVFINWAQEIKLLQMLDSMRTWLASTFIVRVMYGDSIGTTLTFIGFIGFCMYLLFQYKSNEMFARTFAKNKKQEHKKRHQSAKSAYKLVEQTSDRLVEQLAAKKSTAASREIQSVAAVD